MLITGRESRRTMVTIEEAHQRIMAGTRRWLSLLTSGLQKLGRRDRRTSICRWMKWRRSSAGEESSSRRQYSHHLCRLLRLLRLLSRRQRERAAAGTTAPSACQARRERRRAAVSSDLPRRQPSQSQNLAARCLCRLTRLHHSRQARRYHQATSSLRTASQCPCQCTPKCPTTHHQVPSSPAPTQHATAHARHPNTTAVPQHRPSPSTLNTLHDSTHHLQECGPALPAQTAPSKTKQTGTNTPPRHHQHPQAAVARAQTRTPSTASRKTTPARPCLQRMDKEGAV